MFPSPHIRSQRRGIWPKKRSEYVGSVNFASLISVRCTSELAEQFGAFGSSIHVSVVRISCIASIFYRQSSILWLSLTGFKLLLMFQWIQISSCNRRKCGVEFLPCLTWMARTWRMKYVISISVYVLQDSSKPSIKNAMLQALDRKHVRAEARSGRYVCRQFCPQPSDREKFDEILTWRINIPNLDIVLVIS